MQTNRIRVNEEGLGREESLKEAARFCSYHDLDHKTSLRIQLLVEETLGMLTAITESFEADLWLESDRDHNCRIHLTAQTIMDYSKKKQLLDVSRSGHNTAAAGFMGKVRDVIANTMLHIDEVGRLQLQYGYGPVMYGSMGVDPESMTTNTMIYTWSMRKYQDALDQARDENQEAREAWDELEKSIVANIADDILVGVTGDQVDLVIIKKM
ncbi:MAG: hypothetical protein IJ137_09640 [Eubacterium sp.]|nr:hypothetical protein [Eubacterium sp.]